MFLSQSSNDPVARLFIATIVRISAPFSSMLLIAAIASAQPVISTGGIVNAASYANPVLPNSSLAQGSLFTIFGKGLGPSASPSLAFPLSTTLGGVSISVSQGSTTVPAIPVFVSGAQVNAILPSDAPLGSDSIALTYQGQTSVAATVQVVAASFAIFTVNSSGSGQGILTNASDALFGYSSAAHPGDIVIIWGTGLGAISGGDTNPPPVGNITANSPIVLVGGVQVTPSYHGRSGCCSGLDQIVFQLPANVAGCNVPISVQIGNTVGNFVSVPIASTGNTCNDPGGLPTSELSSLATRGSASTGNIVYQTYNDTSAGFSLLGQGPVVNTGTQELATFSKDEFTNLTALAPILNSGACTVYTFSGASFNAPGVIGSQGLDAGKSITVTGGGSQGQMDESSTGSGVYSARFNLPTGSVTFTGAGGADVGAFSVNLTVGSENLNWTNESAITSITRSSGVKVTWAGADPNGTVQITGGSAGGTSTATAAGAGFTCTASGSAGQFTVPASVLLALPASGNFSTSLLSIASGFLGISSNGTPVSFSASGLDFGRAFTQSSFSNSTVTYQ